MQFLKQSTAATVVVGPVLDADGLAVTTAVAANFSIAKNGTVAALTSETVNHSANGYYTIELTTTNTNTLGRLDIIVNASTMSMANHRYDVLVAATYDAIVTTGVATGAQSLDIQSRIPATLDGGNMRSSVQSMAPNVLTAAALAGDAVTEIQSGLATTVAVAAAFTEIKGAGWSAGTDTLEEIADAIAGISSGTGGGARTVTITVNDGTNPLQNAKVRVTQGAESYLGTTNASGVVTFNLDDATWTVAITKPGYTYAGTTLVVDGNESATYSMTAVTITPSSGSLVTGYWVCYSELGVVESGVSITMQATKVPADTGFALDSAIRTSTSGSDGVAQFTNLIPGATYRVKRNSGDYYTIKIDDDATGSVELNSILGT
jgi:hypothetical protein